MRRINKRMIDALAATGKEQFHWDAELRGFGVRVSREGRVSYIVQYRAEGRQRPYKIGPHGSPWTPERARTEARRIIGEIAGGHDPQQRRFDDRSALNIAELCDRYLEEGLFAAKPTSVASARCNIENHIKPLIGKRRAASLERGEIEAMMREIALGKTARRVKQGPRRLARVRGGKGAANSTLVTLSAALGFGVTHQVRPDNPALGIRKYPGKKMQRFLSPAELARLGQVLAAATSLGVESPFALAAIRLLMLTGCRKNEILTLKRSHIDRYHRCLKLPDSKTGAKIVHLGAAAMRVIETIPEVAGNNYLLPGKADGTHVTDLQSVWERVRAAAELQDVRLYDLRHSFASVGAATGDSMLIIGALLGHSSPKTTARYTHLADHPLKSAADRISQMIEQYLGELDPARADVIQDLTSETVPAKGPSLTGS
jgi:integrase